MSHRIQVHGPFSALAFVKAEIRTPFMKVVETGKHYDIVVSCTFQSSSSFFIPEDESVKVSINMNHCVMCISLLIKAMMEEK